MTSTCSVDGAGSRPLKNTETVLSLGGHSVAMSGTVLTRFLNNYSVLHDVPFESVKLTSDRYLDENLNELLLEDRRLSAKHHRTTDKKSKEFQLQKWQQDRIQRQFAVSENA